MQLIKMKQLLLSCLSAIQAGRPDSQILELTLRKLRRVFAWELDREALGYIRELQLALNTLSNSSIELDRFSDVELALFSELCHYLKLSKIAKYFFSRIDKHDWRSQASRRHAIEILGGSGWNLRGLEYCPDACFHSQLGEELKREIDQNPSIQSLRYAKENDNSHTILYSVNFTYLVKFVVPALCSAVTLGFPRADLNALVVMPSDEVDAANAYLKSMTLHKFIKVSLVADSTLNKDAFTSQLEYNTALCCARFRWAYRLIEMNMVSANLIIVDADQLFIGDFRLVEAMIPSTVGIALANWQKVLPLSSLYSKYGASLVVCNLARSPKVRIYLRTLGRYLDEHFKNVPPLWTIDQIGLLHVAKITGLNQSDLYDELACIISCGPVSVPTFQDALLYNQAGAGKFAHNSYTEICSALTNKFRGT